MACGSRRKRDGHSSGTPVARRIMQPTRMTGPDGPEARAPTSFLFGLAPGGVCRAAAVAGSAVRSYRTVSPLPRLIRYAPRRAVLGGTVPEARSDSRREEMALEGGDDVARRVVILAGFLDAIAIAAQCALQPRDLLAVIARFQREAVEIERGRAHPVADAGFAQQFPGKLFARILLARRCDIRMRQ